VTPEMESTEAFQVMQRSGNRRLIVRKGDHLYGVLDVDDLIAFIAVSKEFGKDRFPRSVNAA